MGFLVLMLIISGYVYAQGNMEEDQFIGAKKNSRGYSQVDAEMLMKEMPMKDFNLINVHIPYEGDIPGTDASIPYNMIGDFMDQYPDKEQTLVLYCKSGPMSASAAKELAALGYTNIIELKGGFNAWKRAGGDMMMR
ncbi:MAG: rhodanese-like domain-containing protein [Spirochaetaceae bacterium]|nr:rhodanese-like domain-containing protein [Spirochaetaceae bacterium]